MTPEEKLHLVMENSNRANERLNGVEGRIDDLEAHAKLDPTEYAYIGKRVNKAVSDYVGVHRLQLTRKQRGELYKDVSSGLNRIAGTRTQLRVKDFEKVESFISDWQPSTATIQIMRQLGNDQTTLKL